MAQQVVKRKRKPRVHVNLDRLPIQVVARRAQRAYWGGGNGGRDFDEAGDPTETSSALNDEERRHQDCGLMCACYFTEEIRKEERQARQGSRPAGNSVNKAVS